MKRYSILLMTVAFAVFALAGCEATVNDNRNTTATTNVNAPGANSNSTAKQTLTEVPRPAKIEAMMKERGEQDNAAPTIKITAPANNATIKGATVAVRLALSGDLKGYHPMKDPATGMGNHIHVILDNQPYEAYYNLEQAPFELRNVAAGKHTLRVFASRPWHESYKNASAFAMATFTVEGGGDVTQPTTTADGKVMANNSAASGNAKAKPTVTPTNVNTNATAAPEGKDVQPTTASAVDPAKPLLTYSRPKGDYKGADAENIMIDFWLSNAKLIGDGGDYRVRYTVDSDAPKMLEKWAPIWLHGWTDGKHTVKLELIDKAGNVVANGDYNATTREFNIAK